MGALAGAFLLRGGAIVEIASWQLAGSRCRDSPEFSLGVGASERHRTIAGSIVGMAHRLRMQVVAEGVEQTTQAAITHELGCDFGQGWWYGRPLSAAQARQWLHAA